MPTFWKIVKENALKSEKWGIGVRGAEGTKNKFLLPTFPPP